MFLALKQVHTVYLFKYMKQACPPLPFPFISSPPTTSSGAALSLVFPCVIDYRIHRAVIRQSNPVSETMNYNSHTTYPYEVIYCENYYNICSGTLFHSNPKLYTVFKVYHCCKPHRFGSSICFRWRCVKYLFRFHFYKCLIYSNPVRIYLESVRV